MFNKILIANRGEIACRIIRTAKRLGVQTVAVYSDADKNALHVKMADEAYCVGPAPSTESYLNTAEVIKAALISGSEAIHPGYGFLSENADFVKSCQKENLSFIGPSPDAICKMGEKNTAKQIMETANVPVVKGYHGSNQDAKFLSSKAQEITFPILIKAIAGGGGKGMRVSQSPDDFEQALISAKSEAKTSFGNDEVLLEQYLPETRHVEVQVFADNHGNAVYLFERDCSIQRRHQKVLEEAPAPGMTPTLRKAMGEAAVEAARSINYEGAGTIEFLLTPNNDFYFMEMNTRLQVEHPITEKITNLDLVEWQLRVASGEPLPITNQSDLTLNGHAIEARIYAENPDKDFTPSTGNLTYLNFPEENQHIRIDTGVTQGDEISIYYDPLIAKLIVWDENRDKAITQLNKALAELHVAGVHTNTALLSAISENKAFISAKLDTHFIEKEREALMPENVSAPKEIIALAALSVLVAQQKSTDALRQQSVDKHSPWFSGNDWRSNLTAKQMVHLKTILDDLRICVEIKEKGIYSFTIADAQYTLSNIHANEHLLSADINGKHITAAYALLASQLYLFSKGKQFAFKIFTNETEEDSAQDTDRITAPMPGTVVDVSVMPGQQVKKGERLIVIEAMKMQHTLYAPDNGTIKDVMFNTGDLIEEGTELVLLE